MALFHNHPSKGERIELLEMKVIGLEQKASSLELKCRMLQIDVDGLRFQDGVFDARIDTVMSIAQRVNDDLRQFMRSEGYHFVTVPSKQSQRVLARVQHPFIPPKA